jgi:hypothetical protein
MIDMGKLRKIAKSEPDLYNILLQEPAQISEKEFLSKFSLLWNLAHKTEVQKHVQ